MVFRLQCGSRCRSGALVDRRGWGPDFLVSCTPCLKNIWCDFRGFSDAAWSECCAPDGGPGIGLQPGLRGEPRLLRDGLRVCAVCCSMLAGLDRDARHMAFAFGAYVGDFIDMLAPVFFCFGGVWAFRNATFDDLAP